MNGWLIFAGAVVLWLLLRPKRRRSGYVPQSGPPRYWAQDASGQMGYHFPTAAQARAAARRMGGEYIGRYDIYLDSERGSGRR